MQRTVLAVIVVASLGWVGTAEAGGGLEFDFLAGRRNYQAARFSRTEGDTSPSLIAAFQGAPFSGVTVAGVGFESNLTINGVRFAIGYARPYVQFSGPIVAQDPVTALVSTVQVRSMKATETLFGLGYQIAVKQAKLSMDLVGTAETVATDLAIGEHQGTYEATGFGFSVRAGVRYPIRPGFYAHAAAEVGLTGSTTVNATFGVGAGLP